MNAHRYRLVFNRARGLIMAVAEIACARGKRPATTARPAAAAPPGFSFAKLRPAAFAALVALGAQLVCVPLAAAQVVAYRAAPAGQQPTVLQAGNGVPLVNIRTPSAAGVSRNTYGQFDVQAPGVILNNSRTNASTQLGGWVQGNPWLATGSARVIVNEVVSANPSQLLGYVEVAGSPAQVVIANPAGVTCNGCGFIGASRATLTTGTPLVNGGNLDGYRVEGGTIRIDGAGMDASRVGYTELIARAVEINAGLWAQTLKVTAGANVVSADNVQATPIAGTGAAPAFAIDVAQLGGMYAGKIVLVGTEAGVGIRNAGHLGASAGEVIVTADGRLINSGDLIATAAGANVELAAQGMHNSGSIGAQHNVVIRNRGDLANTGAINGSHELIVATTGALANHGGTLEAQRLDLGAAALDNVQGKIRQTGAQTLAIDTGSLANRNGGAIGRMPLIASGTGSGAGGGTSVPGESSGTASGTSTAGSGTTVLPAAPVVLADGRIAVQGLMTNDGGEIVANGSTALASQAGFINSAAVDVDQLTARGNFSNAHGRIAARQADIGTGRLDNAAGSIVIRERLDLAAHELSNRGGSLQLTGNADLGVRLAGDLDNTAGLIATNGANLTLAAATLTNADGRIEHAGSGTLTVTAGTLAGPRGTIVGNGALALTAQSAILDAGSTVARSLSITADALSNQGGQIAQAGTGDAVVTVSGRLDNRDGTLAGNGKLALSAGSLDNGGGRIEAVDTLQATVAGDVGNAAGVIAAGQNLTLTAVGLDNAGGTLGAVAGTLAVTASGLVDNRGGRIEAAQDLTLKSRGLGNADGTVVGKQLSVDTERQALDNRRGRIVAAAALNLQTGAVDNTAGHIEAGKGLDLTAASLANAQGNIVQTGSDGTTLAVAGTLDNSSGRIASNSTDLRLSAQTLANADGRIEHAGSGTLAVTAGTLAGPRGTLVGNGTLVLTAQSALLDAGSTVARSLSITADALSNQGGQIAQTGTGDAAVTVSGRLDNRGGTLAGNGKLTLSAGSLDNAGGRVNAAGDLQATVTGDVGNAAGVIAAGRNLTLTAAGLDNAGGTLGAVAGTLAVTASGLVDNRAGRIEAAQDLTLKSRGLGNADGTVVGKQLSVDTERQALDNRRGRIVAAAALDLQTGDIDNAAGFLGARSTLDIRGGKLANTAAGRIVGEGDIAMAIGQLDNRAGQVEASGTLGIAATGPSTGSGQGTLDNRGGLLRAGDALTLGAASVDNSDTLGANQGIEGRSLTIAATTIDNRRGALRADTALTLTSSGTIDNSAGLVSSAETVVLQDNAAAKTLAVTNAGGTIIAGQSLTVDAASLGGDGQLLSRGDLAVKLAADYTHTGELTANGRARLETAGTLANAGKMRAGTSLALTAATLDNRAAGEIVAPTLTLTATDTNTLINRGLINGTDTRLTAITLNNLGTGRIYGDHLSIAATTLNNATETVNGVTSAPIIAARDRLDLGVTTLLNRDGALLFSVGDMAIGGALDADRRATGRATSVENTSAGIEALDDLAIDAATVTNQRRTLDITREVNQGATSRSWVRCDNPPKCSYWTDMVETTTQYLDKVTAATPAAFIRAGRNMWFAFDTLANRYSTIEAGGNLSLTGSTLINEGAELYRKTDIVTSEHRWHYKNGLKDHGVYVYATSTSALSDTVPAIISAGGTLTGSFTGRIDNVAIRQNTAPTAAASGTAVAAVAAASVDQGAAGAGTANASVNGQGASAAIPVGSDAGGIGPAAGIDTAPRVTRVSSPAAAGGVAGVVATVSAPGKLPGSRLYRANPKRDGTYVMETDPQFANYRQWLSSDYLLKALALDPATTQKRLGDGFVEQRLITEQVGQLTGRRFLAGYQNDEVQYRALLDAGVAFARQWQLRPGVALSAEQMARLTTDMVWLVEKEVTLADGSTQKVLVPQVYARLQDGDLAPSGALLAGASVDLNTTADLVNSGRIAGRQVVALSAENIRNLGGNVAGKEIFAAARNDLQILGGGLTAEDRLAVSAGRDLTVESSTVDLAFRAPGVNGGVRRTDINRVAGLYVTGDNGTLVASAGRDLALLAAALVNGEPTAAGSPPSTATTTLAAGRDLTIGTVTESRDAATTSKKTRWSESASSEVGSSIQTAGDLTLLAGNDLSAKAATVQSGGAIDAAAGRDLTIAAGEASYASDYYRKSSSRGLFSKKSTTIHNTVDNTTALTSTFSAGDTVTLTAGRDLAVQGSNVASANDTILAAGRDIRIDAATETHSESRYRSEKKSGLSASLASGVSVGKSSATQNGSSTRTTAVGSEVGGDNVLLSAGRDATVSGSRLLADRDLDVVAGRDVNILAAQNTYEETQSFKSKSSSLQLIGGAAPRQTLYGNTSAAQNSQGSGNTATASLLSANAGNLTVTAGGDAQTAGTGRGNVTSQGADLLAGQDLRLEGNAVNLLASEANRQLDSTAKSKSVNVGAALAGTVGGQITRAYDMAKAAQEGTGNR
ncbi:MAG: hemagglutinin repeat-containing protein, partial [Rhodocyclales bacterium]|nr:hemagglutinin repeat-containing protein [Rhodocyclales bacterium]